MQTDDLVTLLSQDAPPVKRFAVVRPMAGALTVGVAVCILLMILTLGIRPDLSQALQSAPFWTKFSYTLVVALISLWIVERAGRPGVSSRLPVALLTVPVIALGFLAIWQLSQPSADRDLLLMGHTAKVCSMLVIYLSVPLLAAAFWILRLMAPTRLRLAGAAAGLLAGSAAATVYAFHCPEIAAPFVFLWYSSGILLSTAAGALLGPVALRW